MNSFEHISRRCACAIGTFDEARTHVNRLRPQMPAKYYDERESELPIPPTEMHGSNDFEIVMFNAHNDTNADDMNVTHGNESTDEEDVKPAIFGEVEIDGADQNALDQLLVEESGANGSDSFDHEEFDPFSDSSNVTESHNPGYTGAGTTADQVGLGSANGTPREANTTETNEKQKKLVKLDDSLEYEYISQDDFRPFVLDDGFQIKANDDLSKNWPFKQNVCIFKHLSRLQLKHWFFG